MAKIIHQSYGINIYFPLIKKNTGRIQGIAERYSAQCWGFLGDEGLKFTFSEEANARGFIKEAKDLGIVTDVELSRTRLEELAV